MTTGPWLNGLADHRKREWVEQHFSDPAKFSPGSKMPPYKFNAQDLERITSYLMAIPGRLASGLRKKIVSACRPGIGGNAGVSHSGIACARHGPAVLGFRGECVYTFDQAQRGETAYREQCMRCHGRFLDGDTLAPPLQGSIFLSSWDGVPLDKLYIRISRDMSENNAGKMNAEVNAAMLAYLLAFNGFPDGKTELPHTVDKLSQIRFEQTKPENKQ